MYTDPWASYDAWKTTPPPDPPEDEPDPDEEPPEREEEITP